MMKYRTIFAPCAHNARNGAKIHFHAKISEFAFYGKPCYNKQNRDRREATPWSVLT